MAKTKQAAARSSPRPWPFLALGLWLGSGGAGFRAPAPASVSRVAAAVQQSEAQALFASLCAACHGSVGAGDGPAAAALRPRPASFKDSLFQVGRTDEQLAAAIKGGKPPMPAFAQQLTPVQIRALVTYIRAFGPPRRKP